MSYIGAINHGSCPPYERPTVTSLPVRSPTCRPYADHLPLPDGWRESRDKVFSSDAFSGMRSKGLPRRRSRGNPIERRLAG